MDYFSPGTIYVLAYSFLLAINSLGLSRLQHPWALTTRYLFWGASFLFVFATLITKLAVNIRWPSFHIDFSDLRSSLRQDASIMDWDWFRKCFLFCCAVYGISFASACIKTGGIPILMNAPDQARIVFYSSNIFINIGLFFGPLSLILGVELLYFGVSSKIQKWLTALLVCVAFLSYLTIAMRLDLFRFLFFALILYHYGSKPLNIKRIALATLVGMAIFVGIFLMRVHGDAVQSLNEIVQVKMPKKYFWFSQIYAYVVSNFWNMDYAFSRYVENQGFHPMSWGFDLFRAVFFLLHLEGPVQTAYGFDGIFNESINMVHGLNSTVYVWHFYKDFGVTGVFLLSFGFGLSAAIFDFNTMRRPTLFRISLWGLFAGIILFSATAALWSFWLMYLNIFFIALAHRKIHFLT